MKAVFCVAIAAVASFLPACTSVPGQSYPWAGSVSVGLTAPRIYDPSVSFHTFRMPDPGGFGTFIQAAIDPLELVYILGGGGVSDEEDYSDGSSGLEYSFTRHEATFGLGYGLAHNLGDRLLVFAGTGWAMAFDHEFQREQVGEARYEDQTHLHYLTSGLNLTGGLQWRMTRSAGIEVGYQSFHETIYVGVVFPF